MWDKFHTKYYIIFITVKIFLLFFWNKIYPNFNEYKHIMHNDKNINKLYKISKKLFLNKQSVHK